MQEYLIKYGSKVIDVENYDLPQKFSFRPLQDEYIAAVDRNGFKQTQLFKISKIVHGMEEDVPVLTLFLSR